MTLLTEQRTITRRLLRRIIRLWPALDAERLDATWPVVLRSLMPVVVEEHRLAGAAGAAFYAAQRAADAHSMGMRAATYSPHPVVLDNDALAAVRTSLTVTGPVHIQQALDEGQSPTEARLSALTTVQGAATRHVLNGARDTIVAAVEDDPVALGWARVPRPDACPFCLLLATRRESYRTKESALRTTTRSKRGAGLEYHDHCKCTVRPVFREDWTPAEHVVRAEAIYDKATRHKSGDAARKAFYAAIREDRQRLAEEQDQRAAA